MGLKDLRGKGRTDPASVERKSTSTSAPANSVQSELSNSPSQWDEMVELAAMRAAPPAPGSLYSEFVDWASQSALFPSKIETALAIHVWLDWEPKIPTGSAPMITSKELVREELATPPKPGFGSFG